MPRTSGPPSVWRNCSHPTKPGELCLEGQALPRLNPEGPLLGVLRPEALVGPMSRVPACLAITNHHAQFDVILSAGKLFAVLGHSWKPLLDLPRPQATLEGGVMGSAAPQHAARWGAVPVVAPFKSWAAPQCCTELDWKASKRPCEESSKL